MGELRAPAALPARVRPYTDGMSPDPGDSFDMDEPQRAIAEAEVLVVQFGWLAERLLVDARRSESAGPYIRVVEPVRTPQERIRQLRELRPGFNDPETYVFFPWAGRVDAFVEAGLFARILDRCGDDPEARGDCETALTELLRLDREDLQQAIRGGDKYHTLYERPSADSPPA